MHHMRYVRDLCFLQIARLVRFVATDATQLTGFVLVVLVNILATVTLDDFYGFHLRRLEYLNNGFFNAALLLRKAYFLDAFGVIVCKYACFCKSVQDSLNTESVRVGQSFPLRMHSNTAVCKQSRTFFRCQ
jgi:hypothetical protein